MTDKLVTGRCGRRTGLFLAVVVGLLIGVFAVAIPFCAFLCQSIHLAMKAELPRLASLLVATSGWLPLAVAVVGTIALAEKERRLAARVARALNLAALVLIALVGGFAMFACLFPSYLLLSHLPFILNS
jgi:hypoxanthine-guanine phosphoribosyltransferase